MRRGRTRHLDDRQERHLGGLFVIIASLKVGREAFQKRAGGEILDASACVCRALGTVPRLRSLLSDGAVDAGLRASTPTGMPSVLRCSIMPIKRIGPIALTRISFVSCAAPEPDGVRLARYSVATATG